ncbi:IS3 family transposase, partial [Acidaminobacter hydrogenoformans]
KLDDAGMVQSMSRVSRCIDNGPMEAFWGMLKSEMYYLRKFDSYEELESAVSEYIDFYNNGRYQKRLDCMTPLEYRQYLSNIAA